VRNTSPQTKQKLSFDRTIRKPVGASTSKEKSGVSDCLIPLSS
jgi:hypothetical protein